jgi:transmembrane sensor
MVPALLLRMQSDYATATAQSRIVTLDDGTTVQLAPDSAIKLDFSPERRQVKLLAGEAFFDVARNPQRPFIVDADGIKVKVLGTAFDVRLSSSDARVELARGAVDVSYDVKAGQAAQTLKPGQMLMVDRTSGAMEKGAIAIDDVASWRGGRIFVNEATVASVVEQIQRYHHAWIAIPDRTLAAQTVTGLYDLNDPDRALRALVQPYGGHVRAVSRFARVLSRF